jgi:transcription elongation factor Elf1
MSNIRIISLLEGVLGQGRINNDEVSFTCPYCHHHKKKLSINIISQKWQCWVCGKKGRKIYSIFKRVNASPDKIKRYYDLVGDAIPTEKSTMSSILGLPHEFIPIIEGNKNSPDFRNAFRYIMKRGFSKYDILRYNLGYCEDGPYSGMIIIPSYDCDGELNYYTGRSFYETNFKHKNPQVSKDIIGFDLLVDWKKPITIVEGPIDAMTVDNNSIPLFGKLISNELKKKIVENRVERINIVLDDDAKIDAIRHAEYFMGHGIDVYLIDMPGKDPNELGRDTINKIIEGSRPLSFEKIMEYKLYEN